jgi:hypothetical protein
MTQKTAHRLISATSQDREVRDSKNGQYSNSVTSVAILRFLNGESDMG